MSDAITVTLNQNGTQLAQLTVDMEDSTFFELEANFQIRSIGVAGQVITNFDFTFKDNGSRKIQLATVDTTTACTLSLNAQFSSNPTSKIQTRLFYLRKQY